MPKPNNPINLSLLDFLRCQTCGSAGRVGSLMCPKCNNPSPSLEERLFPNKLTFEDPFLP